MKKLAYAAIYLCKNCNKGFDWSGCKIEVEEEYSLEDIEKNLNLYSPTFKTTYPLHRCKDGRTDYGIGEFVGFAFVDEENADVDAAAPEEKEEEGEVKF